TVYSVDNSSATRTSLLLSSEPAPPRTYTLSLHDALPISDLRAAFVNGVRAAGVDVVDIGLVTTPILYFATAHWKLDGGANITGRDRKSTRLNSSHGSISYAVFCLKKKKKKS